MSRIKTIAAVLIGCSVLGGLGFLGFAAWGENRSYPPLAASQQGPYEQQVERGKYVAAMGDCAACHTVHGKPEYAGGYALQTPFGVIKASNITQDVETGIGGWTAEQFDRAVRHGVGTHGYLYPAMPYTAYTKMTDQDISDLWAYMKTISPVKQKVVENELPFPYNQRFLLAGWNSLFFKDERFSAAADATPEVTRGDYLVNGPGHCSSCHTGKNPLGGDVAGTLQGGTLQGWHAPDLTPNPHTGLGKWTTQDIVTYLKTGTGRQAVASGPMQEAVENSTQHLTDSDLAAIAAYLQQLPESTHNRPEAITAADPQMVIGKIVMESQCNACHGSDGAGVRNMIPMLKGNPQVNAPDISSLVHTILMGVEGPMTTGNPTGAGMPRFDWKLPDDDVAAVLTYIRNSWGNSGSRVTASEVKQARAQLGAKSWPQ